MSNIVGFTANKREVKPEPNEAESFISNFYEWAIQQGIDTTTTEFKWDAATVLTVVRGLLHKRN